MKPAPWRNLANLLLLAAFCWLEFGGGGGLLPVAPGPIRVLVVYDTAEQPINSTNVIHYLRTHCVKDGDTAAFRQWPASVDATNESEAFKKLFAMPHEKLPWAFIQMQSGRVVSEAVPPGVDDQLALFTRYGGP